MVCPHSYRTRRAERVERDGPIELVVFDMDGVLIDNGSSWVLVHRHFGVQNEGGLTRYLAGQIDDHEFVRTDVALWTKKGPVHTTMLDKILSRPDFMLGARETVKALHDHGMVTAIVSGGLDYMANRVAHALGIDDVYANGLHVDARGNITGEGILRVPLKDKSVPLPLILKKHDVEPGRVAAIGDSCPDSSLFEAVGLGIAFNPADPCVSHVANVTVQSKDLRDVLPHILPAG